MRTTTGVRSALGAILGLSMLLGWTAQAQSQAATPGNLKPYRAEDFEKVLIPNNPELYVGQTLRLKTDLSETIVLDLGYKYVADNLEGIDATVGGIPFSLPPGSLFTRRTVKGGRLGELPADALILCRASEEKNFGQTLAAAATLGLTQLATRYAQFIQLCGVDADRDGSLEKFFLVGAKQQQDLEFTSTRPIPYRSAENYQVDDVKLILYPTKGMFSSPALAFGVRANGRLNALTNLQFYDEKRGVNGSASFKIKKDKLPQEMTLGSAVVVVEAYDEVAGTVDIRFKTFFAPQKIDWYIAPQTLYIYY